MDVVKTQPLTKKIKIEAAYLHDLLAWEIRNSYSCLINISHKLKNIQYHRNMRNEDI